MTKLRLLKVIVQPIFVIDDGENLTEHPAEPIAIAATEWPTYATSGFLDAFEALQRQVETLPKEHPGDTAPT
jgi:hypothetical protein